MLGGAVGTVVGAAVGTGVGIVTAGVGFRGTIPIALAGAAAGAYLGGKIELLLDDVL
jgi:hypothetical protein